MNPLTSDQPQHRIVHHDSGALSNTELLSIVLDQKDNRLSERLIQQCGGPMEPYRTDLIELRGIHGIGPVRAARLKAVYELSKRLNWDYPARTKINSPADLAQFVRLQMADLVQEELWVLLLNTRLCIIEVVHLYKGSLDTTLIRIGEVFAAAIKHHAAMVTIVHNHPSGDPSPSPEDLVLTRQVIEAGKLLGIGVLDSLIVGKDRFVSLKERGLAFE